METEQLKNSCMIILEVDRIKSVTLGMTQFWRMGRGSGQMELVVVLGMKGAIDTNHCVESVLVTRNINCRMT
jgi:hypothetical protein